MTGYHVLLAAEGLNIILFIIFPVWAFVRLHKAGLLVATLFIWVLELLVHPAVAAVSPGGLWPFVWLIWLWVGWLFSFVYVAVVSLLTMIVLAVIDKVRKKPASDGNAVPALASESAQVSWGRRFGIWFSQLYPVERVCLLLLVTYLSALAAVGSGLLAQVPQFTRENSLRNFFLNVRRLSLAADARLGGEKSPCSEANRHGCGLVYSGYVSPPLSSQTGQWHRG